MFQLTKLIQEIWLKTQVNRLFTHKCSFWKKNFITSDEEVHIAVGLSISLPLIHNNTLYYDFSWLLTIIDYWTIIDHKNDCWLWRMIMIIDRKNDYMIMTTIIEWRGKNVSPQHPRKWHSWQGCLLWRGILEEDLSHRQERRPETRCHDMSTQLRYDCSTKFSTWCHCNLWKLHEELKFVHVKTEWGWACRWDITSLPPFVHKYLTLPCPIYNLFFIQHYETDVVQPTYTTHSPLILHLHMYKFIIPSCHQENKHALNISFAASVRGRYSEI